MVFSKRRSNIADRQKILPNSFSAFSPKIYRDTKFQKDRRDCPSSKHIYPIFISGT